MSLELKVSINGVCLLAKHVSDCELLNLNMLDHSQLQLILWIDGAGILNESACVA